MSRDRDTEQDTIEVSWGKLVGIGFGVLLLVVLVFAALLAYTPISRGRVAVITRFGKVQPGVLYPGLHWRWPFVDGVVNFRTEKIVYETSLTPETSNADYKDYCVDTSSSDGQQVNVCYTCRVSLMPEKVEWLANNLFDEERIIERIVKMDTRAWARALVRNYEAEKLYTGNIVEVQIAIATRLGPLFEANGVLLDEFVIREVHFSPDYIEAMEAKQVAEQTVTTRQHEAEQGKYEAERKVNLAQGEADARRIQADAEAYAISAQGESLRAYPEVIQWQFVQTLKDPNSTITWGILPPDMGVVPFFQLPLSQTQTTP